MKASSLVCALGIICVLFIVGCSGDSDGGSNITSVQAGTGLTGGGDSGDLLLEVDTEYTQRRVSARCSGEKAVQSISSVGGVVCSEDLALQTHSHAEYSSIDHNHDTNYSAIDHNHDSVYSPLTHNHDGDYSPAGHNHDANYLGKDVVVTTTAAEASGLVMGAPLGVLRVINDSSQTACGVTDCDKNAVVGASVGDNSFKYGVVGYAAGTGTTNVGVLGVTSGEAGENIAGYFVGDTVITGHLKLARTGPGFNGVIGLNANDVGGYFVVGNFHNVTIDLSCDTICARHGMECGLALRADGTMSVCNLFCGDVNCFEYCWCQKR